MKISKTATEALKTLWHEGFFKKSAKQIKIDEFLSKEDHHFSSAELGMALKRAKFLTRKGARGNYEYIQKHPYFEETKAKK